MKNVTWRPALAQHGLRGRSRDNGSAGKKPQARGNNAHRRTVLASGTRDGGDSQACGVSSIADFLTLPGLVASFDQQGYDLVEMVLADQKAGTGTKPRNG